MIISVNLGSYLTSQSKRWMIKTRGHVMASKIAILEA